ncbi:L-rhamnose mutarotase [Streptomyces sp. NBC_01235]|uniref:L-rhamnose mutarotase n=1 Tax=Streptomyces sp. NBC_01235 TaxID=2903788 RepID=UPI002E13ECF7|nr:L-rhamnose mutarotase [Streptomyces sp. NBC_01235]
MRVALHTKVRADRIEPYEAAHREVPEELTAAIRAAGVREWTIRRCGSPRERSRAWGGADLFHVPEAEDCRTTIVELDKLPVNIAWQARTADLLDVVHDYPAQGADASLPVVWER